MTHLRNDITLSTGRTFRHYPMDNGAQELCLLDDDADQKDIMTDAEWDEYCMRQKETQYKSEDKQGATKC